MKYMASLIMGFRTFDEKVIIPGNLIPFPVTHFYNING